MGQSTSKRLPPRRPTFTITCSVLALIGFGQLMAVGVAAAIRSGETREVIKYVQSDPIIVSIPTLPDNPTITPTTPRNYQQLMEEAKDYTPTIKNSPATLNLAPATLPTNNQTAPPIDNPRIRELIAQAHRLHKPAINYRKALIFQDMGHWKKAGDEYETLFGMGPKIGAYYQRATLALANGVSPKINTQNLMILGNIIQRINEKDTSAKLIIPVRSTGQDSIEPELVEIKIHFYDIVDGKKIEPVPTERKKQIITKWLSNPVNWEQSGEETLEATYTLPPLRLADVHIFGDRKYYGYVAQLYYKGKILDQQASQGNLHALHAKGNNRPQLPGSDGQLPLLPLDFPLEPLPIINQGSPLLPPLPQK